MLRRTYNLLCPQHIYVINVSNLKYLGQQSDNVLSMKWRLRVNWR
jgi:hypothetical protein